MNRVPRNRESYRAERAAELCQEVLDHRKHGGAENDDELYWIHQLALRFVVLDRLFRIGSWLDVPQKNELLDDGVQSDKRRLMLALCHCDSQF